MGKMIESGAMERVGAEPDSLSSARGTKGFENLVLIVFEMKNQRPPDQPGMSLDKIPNRPPRRPCMDDVEGLDRSVWLDRQQGAIGATPVKPKSGHLRFDFQNSQMHRPSKCSQPPTESHDMIGAIYPKLRVTYQKAAHTYFAIMTQVSDKALTDPTDRTEPENT